VSAVHELLYRGLHRTIFGCRGVPWTAGSTWREQRERRERVSCGPRRRERVSCGPRRRGRVSREPHRLAVKIGTPLTPPGSTTSSTCTSGQPPRPSRERRSLAQRAVRPSRCSPRRCMPNWAHSGLRPSSASLLFSWREWCSSVRLQLGYHLQS
jgi:hypothetical protein